MIKINYYIDCGFIRNLCVQGHAEYRKVNNIDVVCACVSSIVIGGLNAIEDINNYKISINYGDVNVSINKANNHDNDVLNTIIVQLKTLETKYPKNIKIKEN